MNHPAQDLKTLSRQILGRSLVLFVSHIEEARQAAPQDAEVLIGEMRALVVRRLAASTDEELRRRKELLYAKHAKASKALTKAKGGRSTVRPGGRVGFRLDRASVNRAAIDKAQRDMSHALSEIEVIQGEISRRANAQAARA